MATSCYRVFHQALDPRWLVLAVLTMLVAAFALKIPGINSKISVADTFILINLIVFGPAAGCITAALEALASSLRCATVSRRLEFALFNFGNGAICTYFSGLIYFLVLRNGPLYQNHEVTFTGLLPSAGVLALSYYLLNSGTVAIMVALESRRNIVRIWKENFLWCSINYFAGTLGAIFIATNGDLITSPNLIMAGLMVVTIYAVHRSVLGKLAAKMRA